MMIDSKLNFDFSDRTKTKESVVIDINYEDLDESGAIRLISINQSTEETSRESQESAAMSGQQKLLLPDDTVVSDLEEAGKWIAKNTSYEGGRNKFDEMFHNPEAKEDMKKRAGINKGETASEKSYVGFADPDSIKDILTEYVDEEEAESIIENGIKSTVFFSSDDEEEVETKVSQQTKEKMREMFEMNEAQYNEDEA